MTDNDKDYMFDDEEHEAPRRDPVAKTQGPEIDFLHEDTAAKSEPTPSPAAASAPRRRHRGRKFLFIVALLAIICGGVAFYLRYCSPYVTDARVTGYITSIEKRGFVFKTFEGEMVTESSLTDTVRVYSRPMAFSVESDSLARRLQALQGSGRPVTLTYERYNATLPWRGSSVNIITAINN